MLVVVPDLRRAGQPPGARRAHPAPRVPGRPACWWSTTAAPTAPASWPTSSPPTTPASPCCTTARKRGPRGRLRRPRSPTSWPARRRRRRLGRADGRGRVARPGGPAGACSPPRGRRRGPRAGVALRAGRAGRRLALAPQRAVPRRRTSTPGCALRLPIRDVTGGFRLFRREVLEELTAAPVAVAGLLLPGRPGVPAVQRAGHVVREVPITFTERSARRVEDERRHRARGAVAGHGVGGARPAARRRAHHAAGHGRTPPPDGDGVRRVGSGALGAALLQQPEALVEELLQLGHRTALEQHVPVGARRLGLLRLRLGRRRCACPPRRAGGTPRSTGPPPRRRRGPRSRGPWGSGRRRRAAGRGRGRGRSRS